MTNRVAAEVFHPGEFLEEELSARGWTQVDLAEILGRPTQVVNEIIQGKRSISPETARGLGDAFGTSAEYWLNLESAYRLNRVKPDTAVTRRATLYSKAPIKDLVRRGWIESSENVEVLENRLLAFMEIKNLDEEPVVWPCAARKSTSYKAMTPAQWAWLCRARHLARTVSVARFDNKSLERVMAALKPLLHHEQETRHVARVLADGGIRFVVLEHLPHTKIDGACFWLDSASPVIAVSLRYDRLDWFWHTLLHEIGHVKNRDGLTTAGSIDMDLFGEASKGREELPEEERLVDEFASDFLVPKEELDNFALRVRPLYSKMKITGFANRIGVHPGIVVGQLQHRKEISYAHNREMLAKIRQIVTASALTDGWGHSVPAI